jgi:hypothetical protein
VVCVPAVQLAVIDTLRDATHPGDSPRGVGTGGAVVGHGRLNTGKGGLGLRRGRFG